MTLALVTFVAFGASWQLAAAAGEGRMTESVVARVRPIARGLLPQTSSYDVRAARSTTSGMALILGDGIAVSLVDGGVARLLRAPQGATVADVLSLAGAALGPLDQLEPADTTAYVEPGALVRIVRVAETTAVLQEEVPFPVRNVADPSLPSGRVVVASAGTVGTAENTYKITTVDGAESARVLLTSVELVAPVAEVHRIGTRAAAAPGDIQAIITAAAAQWGADANQLLRVAYCESHYNPYAYNAGSGASGLFQFLPSTWAANSVRAGYGGASPFDAVANANTAAMMFARGQAGQWVCK